MSKQSKRWEFVSGSELELDEHIVRRIIALADMPQHAVKTGDLGGYVENEANLPQNSHAWVFGDAKIYGKAKAFGKAGIYDQASVFGDAQVFGQARISGDAQVFGQARIYDDALVFGQAQVYDGARVHDDAWVYDDAQVYDGALVYGDAHVCTRAWIGGDAVICDSADWITVGPAISSRRFTTAHRDAKLGVRINCGCFSGSIAEFAAAIENTHQSSQQDLARYRAFHRLIVDVFGKEGTCE